MAYARSRTKSALINDWENILFWGESEQNGALINKFDLFKIQVRRVASQEHFANSISITETDTKLLHKYKHFFFLKASNWIINWILPLILNLN